MNPHKSWPAELQTGALSFIEVQISSLSNEQVPEALRAAPRLQLGEEPTQSGLATALVLDSWIVHQASASVARLGGYVCVHPLIADGWWLHQYRFVHRF